MSIFATTSPIGGDEMNANNAVMIAVLRDISIVVAVVVYCVHTL
jgi:hypothetical protein